MTSKLKSIDDPLVPRLGFLVTTKQAEFIDAITERRVNELLPACTNTDIDNAYKWLNEYYELTGVVSSNDTMYDVFPQFSSREADVILEQWRRGVSFAGVPTLPASQTV